MTDAKKETFELVMLDEYPVLFTSARIDRKIVPKDLFCYDVWHDDDGQGIACEVKAHVLVNHWGTVLSKKEIPIKKGGSYYPREDMNYLGETLTMDEYMHLLLWALWKLLLLMFRIYGIVLLCSLRERSMAV